MRWRGRVLWVSGSRVILGRGATLLESTDDGATWRPFATVPVPWYKWLIYKSHRLTRLLRAGFHHLVKKNEDSFYLIFDRSLYVVSQGGCEKLPHDLVGSRPLCVAAQEGKVFYGEYWSNAERRPARVFRVDEHSHEVVLEIPGVRHVHGVFFDPHDHSMWVTTGDYDDEAAIWRLDGGALTRIVSGGQQARAVQLLFTPQAILYGTDTPLDDNFVYEISRSDLSVRKVASVSSSVFYGATPSSGYACFSTVIEPSPVNHTRNAELWVTDDSGNWTCIVRARKDVLPKKLFQYGQLMFPEYDGASDYLWFYCMSVHGSGFSERRRLSELLEAHES